MISFHQLVCSPLLAMSGSGAPPGANGLMGTLLPFVVMFIAFYFLIIAPQNKREKNIRR